MPQPRSAPLAARDVCQPLRDAALGLGTLRRLEPVPASGLVRVDIDGWHLTLDIEHGHLHHCPHCRSPDGRVYERGQFYGTDPVYLLSTWELAQLERLLGA
ncbi:hypothetical protein G3435_08670 [Pseudomonas sp. MAFF212428]|uniref:DUF7693 domain-containing protein n=1 Tax=Pseudomonas brassicae TaxID=2708063 RepID=A0A6B3NVI5_9PSED|nr:hypothetical protein [Pseudomonas brassicae]NER65813.1 hypothetical protein [Pseudomonas brassicae]